VVNRLVSIGQGATLSLQSRDRSPHRSEKRTAVRYPLEVLLVYRWSEDGIAREAVGCTRDLSVRGAYVLTKNCPPLGAAVDIKMNLLGANRGRAKWINARGFVLRLGPESSGRRGFAVESDGPRLFAK
jgi:hypothetical protein